jgi:hypothetical protein
MQYLLQDQELVGVQNESWKFGGNGQLLHRLPRQEAKQGWQLSWRIEELLCGGVEKSDGVLLIIANVSLIHPIFCLRDELRDPSWREFADINFTIQIDDLFGVWIPPR